MFQARSIPSPAARSTPMDPPGITRRRRPRRPFLAPLWMITLAVLAAVGVALLILHSANTTVVVVVHPVEQGPGDDPPLSAEGEQRAQRLAAMFGSQAQIGQLNALYVSDARRSQQTVAPLAELLGKQPVVVPRDDPEGTAARVMEEHQGDTVLVVGTSAMTPDLVRHLSGVEIQPGQDDVGYVVSIPSIGRANLLRFRY
jgi:phosphohistidine phosphatase SixA